MKRVVHCEVYMTKENQLRLVKIISGGQTGVDLAALDIAMEFGLCHGGWCPHGRRAENGRIPDKYQLIETVSKKYQARTRKNVECSDGTLIIYRNTISGGTKFTRELAEKLEKPFFLIDAGMTHVPIEEFWNWVCSKGIETLNIAGPRLSSDPELAQFIHVLLRSIFSQMPGK